MSRQIFEQRITHRPLSESEQRRRMRVYVDYPAHSLAVIYSLVAIVAGVVVLITVYVSGRFDFLLATPFYKYAAIGLSSATITIYEIIYHGIRYRLTNQLREIDDRPYRETITETTEETPEPMEPPAPNPTIRVNEETVRRDASPHYAGDFMFTGRQWDWMRLQVLKGDMRIRRETSKAGLGWTDLERGPHGAGNTITARRNHLNQATAALRRERYINHAGVWTEKGIIEFLELEILPHPESNN